MLFYGYLLIQFHLNLSINIPCECAHIVEQKKCNSSQKCLWNNEIEKCQINMNSQNNNQPISYCSQFMEDECIQNKKCAFHLGICQDLIKCESLLSEKCLQSSFWCVSNGQNCIPKNECQYYKNKQACGNQNIDGKFCIWKTTNNEEKCQDVENCEELPQTLNTDSDCKQQISICTVQNQGGCTKQKEYCYQYKFKEQCFLSLNNIKCFWEEGLEQCFEKKCSNKYLITHQECSQFLQNCTTNGIQCIERQECKLYQYQSGCVIDNKERPCIYYQGQCYTKNCASSPETVKSMIECQMFDNQDQYCVPQKKGGCKIKPNNCDQLETQDSCQMVNQLSGRYCIWNELQQICKIKQCMDAPLNFEHEQCIKWLNDYDCISKLGNGCIDNVDNCKDIKNLKSCIINRNHKKCVIENDQCYEEECKSFKYPKYDTDKKCSDRLNICTYNYLTKTCVNKECQNLSENECNNDYEMNKCLLPTGCVHKRCESASIYLSSYEDCQNWDIRCTINVILTQDTQYLNGCITKFLECNQFKHQLQCRSTLQGIPCYWNIQIKQCQFQTCDNAPISFNTISQCQEWVKYHNQKCVNKLNGGCIEQFPLCQQLTDELQCKIGALNNLCFWNNQTQNCEDRTCMNASTTINANLQCRQWLSSCKLNDSGFGCDIDKGIYNLCTDAPEIEQFSTHEECQAWNPKCTIKLGLSCSIKLDCESYLTQNECLTDINNQPCKWNGSSCIKQKCSDYPGTPLNSSDCQTFSSICTISTQNITCQDKKANCSEYIKQTDCNVNSAGQKCQMDDSLVCQHIADLILANNYSCSYEDKDKGYLYQYHISNICVITPLNCNQINQNDCNSMITINQEICTWNGTQCSIFNSQITNTQINCRKLNQAYFLQSYCKSYSNQCEFDFIQMNTCTYNSCLNVSKHQCNFITLNNNIQCSWNVSTCQIRTCYNMNEQFNSIYQCILWLDSCTYDQLQNICKDRTSCSQETTELLCNKASYITQLGLKIYCFWNINLCSDITSCSQIQNPSSHRVCQDKLQNCTSLTNPSLVTCIEAPLFCNQIQDQIQCYRNSKFEKCSWNQGKCFQLSCLLNYNLPIYNLLQFYQTCQNRQPFCVFDIENRNCMELNECKLIPNLVINEENCARFSPLCRINEQYDGCIRNTKCSQASTYFQQNCELFLLHRKCRRKEFKSSCQPLARFCSFYSKQQNCKFNYKQNKCYWQASLNVCINFSCNSIEEYVQTHQDCQLISPTCTISIQNSIYSCTNLLECDQYQYEHQCVINIHQQLCIWMNNQCLLDNCRNVVTNIIYDIQLCEQYGSNCTINEDRSGCIIKKQMCKSYNQFQCLTPGQKNLLGLSCFWDQIDQICSEIICDQAPQNYNLLFECQSFNYNCQPNSCRLAKCEDFQYKTDIKCSLALINNKCTTNGLRCIDRQQCENAINIEACTYSNDYRDCQWLIDENYCVIKSCNSAPKNINSHFECEDYFIGCTSKLNGGCIKITTCNSIQTKEGCIQDQFGMNCLWQESKNECINLICETMCGDGIVGNNEECDDGNIYPYDGCYKCKIQCQYGCNICNQQICLDCQTGYELNSNGLCYEICGDGLIIGKEECDDMNNIKEDGCFNCQFQCHQQCLICAQGICLLCNYGWQSYNNQCQTICGNGLLVEQYEQCDDGNNESFDGCDSYCQIEKNWICNQSSITGLSECINQEPPQIQLSNLSQKKDSQQIILFSFNQKIILKQPCQFEDYIKINITNNTNFKFTVIPITQATLTTFHQAQYQICISLLEQVKDPYATISILQTIVINNLNQQLTDSSQTISLGTPLILSEDAKNRLDNAIQFNEIMIFVFIGSSTLSVLTGNFDLFFNMLALLQQLSYVRYLAVPFPTHLQEYLKVFKIISFQPLYDKLQIDYYFSKLNFGKTPFIQSHHSNQEDPEFNNAFFLVNAKSFYITMFTSFTLYVTSKMIRSLSILIYTKLQTFINYKKLKIFYKGFQFVKQFSEKTTKYFFYSGIIKVFISTQYQLMYSAYSQFPEYQFNMQFEDMFVTFNSFNALFAIILPHLFLFQSIVVLQKQYKQTTQNQFSIFYENVKQTYWARFFIPFSMIKVAIYMAIICFLTNSPIIQIISLIIQSNLYFYYLLVVRPCIQKLELIKNLGREIAILLFFSSLFPYELTLNEEIITLLGWIHIGLFTLIIAQNVVLDFLNQLQQLLIQIQKNRLKKQKKQKQLEKNTYKSFMIVSDNNIQINN
ncbi:unnamed protein product [Paramecium sonneborni]|uniref:PSI domain-containing protein n=1 Tax=Paramecium sonneborni TaxID=65129 RepID=A0A8S1P6H9_9CILI|nr:unnamed protein product [Paramecium sonneborni]